MKKRLQVLVLLITLLLCLPGCAMVDKAKNAMASVKADAQTSKMQSDLAGLLTSGNVTDDTIKAGEKYMDKLNSVEDLITRGADGMGFWEKLATGHPINSEKAYSKALSKKQAKANKEQLKFNLALSKDELFLASQTDAADPGVDEDKSKKLDVGVIIIIVVVLLLIVLFFFLRSRSNKPAVRAVSDSKRDKASVTLHDHSVHANANKMNACRHLAKKYGVDADDLLQKCGGDVDELYLQLQRMRPLDNEED